MTFNYYTFSHEPKTLSSPQMKQQIDNDFVNIVPATKAPSTAWK